MGRYLEREDLSMTRFFCGAGLIQGETPIQFLNKIQKVGYCLNSFTITVAETLIERGYKVGKFVQDE